MALPFRVCKPAGEGGLDRDGPPAIWGRPCQDAEGQAFQRKEASGELVWAAGLRKADRKSVV